MIVVVMGVTGCGKTTLGRELARRLNVHFHDADDYHPPANRAKLRANIPLGDDDRRPWLEDLARHMAAWDAAGGAVLACSALKEGYRVILRGGGAGTVVFVFVEGEAGTIAERLKARAAEGHELIRDYDRILAGQFRDLEEPTDAVRVSNLLPPDAMADEAMRGLGVRGFGPQQVHNRPKVD